MGVLDFAELDTEEQGLADENVALEMERLRETRDSYVASVTNGPRDSAH
jgi:hypothetical protein